MRIRKRWIQGLAAVLLGVLLAFDVVLGLAIHRRNRALAFLADFTRLKLGVSSFADAQRLAQDYGGKPRADPGTEAQGSAQNCSLRFVFKNNPVNLLPGVRDVEFVAGLTVKDGYVVSQELDYSFWAAGWDSQFVYLMNDRLRPAGAPDYDVKGLKLDAQGIPHVLVVSLGPLATEDQRKRAYSLDLACLAKLRGCNGPSNIFPPGLRVEPGPERR
jgi:hypothetical protein